MHTEEEAADRRRGTPARLTLAAAGVALALLGALQACGPRARVAVPSEMKMLVLGMDGLDPVLLRQYMDAGLLPNFRRLAERGTFMPLETAMPPQSPVAWSNFISGAYPDTHMIWDFIHRDPAPDPEQTSLPILPYESIAQPRPVASSLLMSWVPASVPWGGNTRLPLAAAEELQSQRRGPAFWEQLVAHGVDTVIYRVPANYPPPPAPSGALFKCLCGMGTPDLTGTNGSFTAYMTDIQRDQNPNGGAIRKLVLKEGVARSVIEGPPNAFKRDAKAASPPDHFAAEVTFAVDGQNETVKVTIGDAVRVLRAGEWSDWMRISLPSHVPALGGMTDLRAIVKLYCETVSPHLKIYATPLQIDPVYPANPISTPTDFSAEIAAAAGLYYTTGIPEDTKALRTGNERTGEPQVLDEDRFLEMVGNLARERHAQFRYALEQFSGGFLFFYFGHTDQLAHVFWRDIDPGHPGRIAEQEGKYDKVIEDVYREMDERLAEAFAVLDDNDVLIIMSDHGFNSFRRGVNLNTWLESSGYQAWRGSDARARSNGLFNIDFPRSQAYAVGINSLFLNLKGRETHGRVDPADYATMLHEIGDRLLELRDDDGSVVVDRIYYVHEEFPNLGPEQKRIAPDILVGYARNYRGSWATTLGGMRGRVIEDNTERWSGDHCITHTHVPGSLLTNLAVTVENPNLTDLAPSILSLWGAPRPDGMIGREVLGEPRAQLPAVARAR